MRAANGLTNIMVEWKNNAPIQEIDEYRADQETFSCLDLYKVQYIECFLSEQHNRMICHFVAPDAESVRQALRGVGLVADVVWNCEHRT